MSTIAEKVYRLVDVDSVEGVRNQLANWCANNEHAVKSIESDGIYSHVLFVDKSALNFDDYSVSVAG